jgi:hypothetical protein
LINLSYLLDTVPVGLSVVVIVKASHTRRACVADPDNVYDVLTYLPPSSIPISDGEREVSWQSGELAAKGEKKNPSARAWVNVGKALRRASLLASRISRKNPTSAGIGVSSGIAMVFEPAI